MRLADKIIRGIGLVFILLLSIGTIITYIKFTNDSHFLQIKQAAIATGYYLPGFYFHVLASSVVLIAGFFQFSKKVYLNRRLHKALGKTYVFGVLFLASPGAFLMTFFIDKGPGVFISFLLQNVLWFGFTVAAWAAIKNKHVDKHVRMMRRSYALAFAAVNLRVYIMLLNSMGVDINFPHNYLVIAFLSWVPNLLLAEVINHHQKKAAFLVK